MYVSKCSFAADGFKYKYEEIKNIELVMLQYANIFMG